MTTKGKHWRRKTPVWNKGKKGEYHLWEEKENPMKGKKTWNFGLTAETDERIKNGVEKRREIVIREETYKKEKNPFYGKKHTEEAKEANRQKHIGTIGWNKGLNKNDDERVMKCATNSGITRKRLHDAGLLDVWNKGKKANDDDRILSFEDHPNWQGGKSYEPYSKDFNTFLKEAIRKRDDYTCQLCFRKQSSMKRKLTIHHIDYDKKNSNPNNLIALCVRCNSKVNFKREYWSKYFQEKILKTKQEED